MKPIGVFLDYLGVLLAAGAPLLEAVTISEELKEDRRWKQLVQGIASHLNQGKTFSEAIEGCDPTFPWKYLVQLRVAEETGGLSSACQRIVSDMTQAEARAAEWQRVSIYPVMVLMAALSCAWIMGNMVLPTFRDLYQGMGVQMPMWSVKLEWALRFGPPMIVSVIVLMTILWKILGKRFQDRIEIVLFGLPWFGTFFKRRALAHILQNISVLLSAHISLQESLRMISWEVPLAFKKRFRSIQQSVTQGVPLSQVIGGKEFAPHWVVAMIRLGEETGHLEEMLARIVDRLEQNDKDFIKSAIALAEPSLVALTGIGVGAFIFLVVGPMFDLMTRIS